MNNGSDTRKKVRGAIGWDLILILAGGLAVYAVSANYDLLERFYEFSRTHDNWELDEFAVVAVYLVLALGYFSLRRLREIALSRRELKLKNRELQKALDEVKELRGLLPICASCKSIRDDEGFWHHVEAYLIEHADVTFTHGLCPDCMSRLYPEYYGEESPQVPPEHLHLGGPDDPAAPNAGPNGPASGRGRD